MIQKMPSVIPKRNSIPFFVQKRKDVHIYVYLMQSTDCAEQSEYIYAGGMNSEIFDDMRKTRSYEEYKSLLQQSQKGG